MEQLSSVEIAHKRRHLSLLRKVQANNALAPAEIKELENYEQMSKSKSVKKTAATVKKKKSAPSKKPTVARIKRLAFQTETIAEAEDQSGLKITTLLKKNSRLIISFCSRL